MKPQWSSFYGRRRFDYWRIHVICVISCLRGWGRFVKETRMSDKRTIPHPAGGTPRRKRSAPTIDLTATEVPPAATDSGPSSEPADVQDQHERATDSGPSSEPADTQDQHERAAESEGPSMADQISSVKQSAWLSVPALASGFFGAVLMAIILGVLWFAGAVPVRYVASSDGQAIDAVAQRITGIEAMLAKVPANDPNVSERLSAVDNAMKSLGVALTALSKRNDEVAANADEARARAIAVEKGMTQLRDNIQNLSRNTPAGLSPADVDTLQKRLAALEQATNIAPADNAVRLALSAAALRDAVASGAPFLAELDEVKSLGADEKFLAPLASYATSGVPTIAILAQELRTLVPAMVKASGGQAPAGGYLERLEASAAKLVRIRPINAPTGDDAADVLARVEKEAASAAIDDALIDLGKLDAATRAPAQAWIAKTQARQAALAAARQLASDTTHALGRQ
jgi:hypothetical protein